MSIEQEKQQLEQQQRDLMQQKNSMQQKIAQQQKQLLHQEQEEKEWRIQQQEESAQADATIKKLEQEHDFAESQRLKTKKIQQEKEFATQKEQKEAELKKQQAQIAHDRQELESLKQDYEKIAQELVLKDKQQRQVVDGLVTKMNSFHASNDVAKLRQKSASLKADIAELKSSLLKEARTFIDLLKVSLDGIEKRISYVEKMTSDGFNKQINQIKQRIAAATRPEELNSAQVAIDAIKKNITSSPLLQSHKNSLYDRVARELEPLLIQKEASESSQETKQITVSGSVEQQQESSAGESAPEQMMNQEPEQEPTPEKSETKTPPAAAPQQKKQSSSSQKTEGRSVQGFVLNKKGDNFDPIEYQNVTVITDKTGRVVRVAYNKQNIQLFPVPKSVASTRDSTPEWIAAEMYAQQLGNDQNRIAQVLKQAKAHHAQQSHYDHADPHYNQELFDYLRLGLIPILEAKAKK
jgi:hypothetical protein